MINEELKNQYKQFSKDYEVFGVFLYGSQNYQTDIEGSDIDTKVIVIPSIEDVVCNRMVSKKVICKYGEVDLKDIREWYKQLFKGSINYLETLFTDYFFINPKYKKYYEDTLSIREHIARYDPHRTIMGARGMSLQKRNRLKDYSNQYRLQLTMKDYIEGKPFKECIVQPKARKYKTEELPQYMRNFVKSEIESYKEVKLQEDRFTSREYMENIIKNILLERFYEENTNNSCCNSVAMHSLCETTK